MNNSSTGFIFNITYFRFPVAWSTNAIEVRILSVPDLLATVSGHTRFTHTVYKNLPIFLPLLLEPLAIWKGLDKGCFVNFHTIPIYYGYHGLLYNVFTMITQVVMVPVEYLLPKFLWNADIILTFDNLNIFNLWSLGSKVFLVSYVSSSLFSIFLNLPFSTLWIGVIQLPVSLWCHVSSLWYWISSSFPIKSWHFLLILTGLRLFMVHNGYRLICFFLQSW